MNTSHIKFASAVYMHGLAMVQAHTANAEETEKQAGLLNLLRASGAAAFKGSGSAAKFIGGGIAAPFRALGQGGVGGMGFWGGLRNYGGALADQFRRLPKMFEGAGQRYNALRHQGFRDQAAQNLRYGRLAKERGNAGLQKNLELQYQKSRRGISKYEARLPRPAATTGAQPKAPGAATPAEAAAAPAADGATLAARTELGLGGRDVAALADKVRGLRTAGGGYGDEVGELAAAGRHAADWWRSPFGFGPGRAATNAAYSAYRAARPAGLTASRFPAMALANPLTTGSFGWMGHDMAVGGPKRQAEAQAQAAAQMLQNFQSRPLLQRLGMAWNPNAILEQMNPREREWVMRAMQQQQAG